MSITNSTNTSIDYRLLNQISNIIGYYLICVVSSVGLVFNLFGIKILWNTNLLKKHKFYKYILVKTVCDLLVCLTGIGYLNNTCLQCIEVQQNVYGIIIYRFYSIAIIRVALFSSAWSEVYLNYNRYSTLVSQKTWITGISLKYYVPVLFGVPFLLSLPVYFSKSIQPIGSTNLYFMAFNSFGRSNIYLSYYLLLFMIELVIPMILLFVLSLLNIMEIKKFVRKKLVMNSDGIKKVKSAEIRFTKVILVLTLAFMLVRLFDLLSGISYRLISIHAINYSPGVYEIINFVRQTAFLLVYFNCAISIFMFASIDQNVSLLMKIALNKMLIINPIEYKY